VHIFQVFFYKGRPVLHLLVPLRLEHQNVARFPQGPPERNRQSDQNNDHSSGPIAQKEIQPLAQYAFFHEDTLIRVTENAVKNNGTSACLKVHSWVFLKDLFYGIMLPSGNDAAHLMAEFMGYVLLRSRREDSFNP
jgi:hypothetical protein